MRIVQSILAIVGVLIVFGFAFIGYEVYQRATDPDHPRAIGRDRAAQPAETLAQLPPGSRIGQMLVLNARVVYHVTLPDGAEQIHILDPRTGTVQVPVTAPAAPR